MFASIGRGLRLNANTFGGLRNWRIESSLARVSPTAFLPGRNTNEESTESPTADSGRGLVAGLSGECVLIEFANSRISWERHWSEADLTKGGRSPWGLPYRFRKSEFQLLQPLSPAVKEPGHI